MTDEVKPSIRQQPDGEWVLTRWGTPQRGTIRMEET